MFWMARIWRQSTVRLTLSLCALFILISLVAGLWLMRQIDRDLREGVDEGLVAIYEDLSDMAGDAADLAESADLFGIEYGFRAGDGTVQGGLRDGVFDRPGFASLAAGDLLAIPAQLSGAPPEERAALARWRVYVAPLGGGRVALAEPIGDLEVALDAVLPMIALLALPMIVVTLLAGGLLGWQQQRRLNRVRDAIGALARGDFTPVPVPDPRRDDLDEVMAGIAHASARLEHSFGQMRRFSQNMAHELRTPLARLRAGIEALPDSEGRAAALAQGDQVIRVFDAVQRIARLSGPGPAMAGAEVDLARAVGVIADLYEDVAQDAGRALLLDIQDPAPLRGDFQLIVQMLSNLVENALRHGQGAIRVGLSGRVLSVSDDGPGVPPEMLGQIFQPFEKGREGGSGLGLALVQAIAGYHGATLAAENLAGAGLALTITFPPPATGAQPSR